jgi:hypothetical protein
MKSEETFNEIKTRELAGLGNDGMLLDIQTRLMYSTAAF